MQTASAFKEHGHRGVGPSAPKVHRSGMIILTVTNSGGGANRSAWPMPKGGGICKRHGAFSVVFAASLRTAGREAVKRQSWGSYRQMQRIYPPGAVMGAKKDALVNMGGFARTAGWRIGEATATLPRHLTGASAATYGRWTRRRSRPVGCGDLRSPLPGLPDPEHHVHWEKAALLGVPLMLCPIGGHAVCVVDDAKACAAHTAVCIPVRAGCRELCTAWNRWVSGAMEIGSGDVSGPYLPGRVAGTDRPGLVRLAIRTRRVYTAATPGACG